jgi:hypothetical protein
MTLAALQWLRSPRLSKGRKSTMTFRVSLLAIVLLFLSSSPASSRITEYWPYKRLFKEADLVVIATAQKASKAKDRFEDDLWPLEFVGINTVFQVEYCVKGKLTEKRIVVLHFRFGGLTRKEKKEKTPREFIIDGPSFLHFRLKETTVRPANGDIQDISTNKRLLQTNRPSPP